MANLAIAVDPVESAKHARLRYVTDSKPGISRKANGKGFRYLDADGNAVRDKSTLARIKSLVIPPAWKDVWICPVDNGHLQATGRDARGRKQSRYHPRWREVRDENKYERMMAFGKALPEIRERVSHDLSRPGLPREKVLATIVRLLETTFIRIGNAEYAKENNSFGLTTMRGRHVKVKGSTIQFKFQGKSGVSHNVGLSDRRLAGIIKRCQDLPGYEVFQYLDEEGVNHAIDSSDVNEYLQEVSRESFTAKDFRTWAGTVLACMMLCEFEEFKSNAEAKRNVVAAIKSVAAKLGNTVSVCRKCYVHPAVLESYMSGTMAETIKKKIKQGDEEAGSLLMQHETALIKLLQQ